MLELFYLPGACSTVPHVALVWSGLEFSATAATAQIIKSADYLAKNSQGQVPLLVDGDWNLTQNIAIIDYVDELAPQAKIYGSEDIRQKAKARQWLAFANSDIHPSFGPLFHPEAISNDPAIQEVLKAKAVKKITKLFGKIDAQLRNKDFLTGNTITIADIYVYITLRWAKVISIDLSHYALLQPYTQRIEANPGVQTVIKAQGIPSIN